MLGRLLKQILKPRARSPLRVSLPDVHRALASGDLAKADQLCESMLAALPPNSDALQLAGIVAYRRGDISRALSHMTRAAETGTGAQPCLGLGRLLQESHRIPEAIEQYRRAVVREPDLYEARIALADALFRNGNLGEAELECRNAIELRPGAVEPHDLLARILYDQARMAEVAHVLHKMRACHVSDGRRIFSALLVPAIYQSALEMDQVRRDVANSVGELLAGPRLRVSDPAREIGITPFYLAYHGMNDRELQRSIARLCRKAYHPAFSSARIRRQAAGRIRIGFVSEHFSSHSVGRVNRGFISHLPRDRFEVTVFSLKRHDDALARRIRNDADHFVEFHHAPLAEIENAIAGHHMDILFYTDVGMDPTTYFLAYSRLAPMQYVGWGHPDTTGIDTLDYYVSADAIEVADAADHYTEPLIRLPAWVMPGYERPLWPDPLKARAEFGLGPDRHIYACPQQPFKLHPDFDQALGEILRSDPRAEVVLVEGRQPHMTVLLKERFQRSVPDVAARIRIMPHMGWRDYINLIAISDVMLDPFHFGGANTSYESLALGVPVVTLPPQFVRGRHTLGCYLKMEMDECVADSADAYVKIALRLGMDEDYRRFVRSRIEERSPVLYGNYDIVAALGDRLEADWSASR